MSPSGSLNESYNDGILQDAVGLTSHHTLSHGQDDLIPSPNSSCLRSTCNLTIRLDHGDVNKYTTVTDVSGVKIENGRWEDDTKNR